MNIVRFPPNSPMEVALHTPQGTIVQGRYGDRVMFHLTDGRVMYVPPIVASKIEAQGIVPGEPFELCKAQVRNGQGRSVEWRLRRAPIEPANGKDAEQGSEPAISRENPENASGHLPGQNGDPQGPIPANEPTQNQTPKSTSSQDSQKQNNQPP